MRFKRSVPLVICFVLITLVLMGMVGIRPGQATVPEGKLFVKVEGLMPPGQPGEFPGASIDAVELSNPQGTTRIYAHEVIRVDDPHPRDYPDSASAQPDNLLGPPILSSRESGYVYSLNAGDAVVAIDPSRGSDQLNVEESRITVYNVDGIHYGNGAPDPYRVSVRRPGKDWKSLGIGSGSMIFPLNPKRNHPYTDSVEQEIHTVIDQATGTDSLPSDIQSVIEYHQQRIRKIQDPHQLKSELVGFYRMYQREKLISQGDIVQPVVEGRQAGVVAVMRQLHQQLDRVHGES